MIERLIDDSQSAAASDFGELVAPVLMQPRPHLSLALTRSMIASSAPAMSLRPGPSYPAGALTTTGPL